MSKSTCPDLQDLREKLLAPRAIVRDENGHLTHPDLPACDEGVRYDDLLAVFGIESAFVGMENARRPPRRHRHLGRHGHPGPGGRRGFGRVARFTHQPERKSRNVEAA